MQIFLDNQLLIILEQGKQKYTISNQTYIKWSFHYLLFLCFRLLTLYTLWDSKKGFGLVLVGEDQTSFEMYGGRPNLYVLMVVGRFGCRLL